MHSQIIANTLRLRDAIFTDPNNDYWFDRGMEAFDQLTTTLGEVQTDEWFDNHKPYPNWRVIAEKCITKMQEIQSNAVNETQIEAALHCPDWDSIEYVKP